MATAWKRMLASLAERMRMPVNVGACMDRWREGRRQRKGREGERQSSGTVREQEEQGGFDGSGLYL